MSTRVLTAKPTDDILDGAIVSSTVAPLTSYSLATLLTRNPAARVRFGSDTVTITFTLGASQRGDVLVIPASNLDAGSSVLTITNAAGLSVAVDVPLPQGNGIPRTIAVDLVAAEPNATTRTSDVWHLVIAGNTDDVALGGAVFLYSVATDTPDFGWGYGYRKQHAVTETANEYLTRYRVNHRTVERVLDLSAGGLESADLLRFEAWFDACSGSVLPSLLWIQIAELDAMIGTWPETFDARQDPPGTFVYHVALLFRELSKGKPLFDVVGVES